VVAAGPSAAPAVVTVVARLFRMITVAGPFASCRDLKGPYVVIIGLPSPARSQLSWLQPSVVVAGLVAASVMVLAVHIIPSQETRRA